MPHQDGRTLCGELPAPASPQKLNLLSTVLEQEQSGMVPKADLLQVMQAVLLIEPRSGDSGTSNYLCRVRSCEFEDLLKVAILKERNFPLQRIHSGQAIAAIAYTDAVDWDHN